MNEQDLVFVGGGHSHSLILKALAMRPIPGARLTLISETAMTPYSGMLPGYVAGHYSFEQTHIDLNHLCRWAGVRWIEARVEGLDLEEQQVLFKDRPPIGFDTLSLDIGSTSKLAPPGAREHATGVKPITGFDLRWRELLDHPADAPTLEWGVIGAGAAGVELILAMAYRLRERSNIELHLVYRGEEVLSGYPDKAVAAARAALAEYGVHCHYGFSVACVEADAIVSDSGSRLSMSNSIWCAGAAAPKWLEESGLLTDKGGFVTVDKYLQSASHPHIFACGDIAHMRDDPRPKAGVYAVRQAPFLEDNLRRISLKQPLKAIKLQSKYLSLLSLGGQMATGERNGIALTGKLIWRMKDYIDRSFMDRLQNLGTPKPMAAPKLDKPHCGGCGGKLGPDLLSDGLAGLPIYKRDEVVPALGSPEDASLLTPPANTTLVQSIDGFTVFSEDLYLVGRAATEHALNDVYAMGGEPLAAHVWVSTSIAHPRLQHRDHRALMQGISEALALNQTTLAGGHSSEAMNAAVGLAVSGAVNPDAVWNKRGVQLGDSLVLNKGIGTGVVFAADMQAQAPADAVRAALGSMCQSNREAAAALREVQPHAVTDVSGFGLLGHLLEMLANSELSTELQSTALPLLEGALELSATGWRSSLYPALVERLDHLGGREHCAEGWAELLLDPQTSGGLLAAIPSHKVEQLQSICPDFVLIGTLLPKSTHPVVVAS